MDPNAASIDEVAKMNTCAIAVLMQRLVRPLRPVAAAGGLGLLAVVTFYAVGCVAPGALRVDPNEPLVDVDVDANVLSSSSEATGGPLSDAGGGVQVGAVSVNGGTLAAIAVAVAAIVMCGWVLRMALGYRGALDTLIRDNESADIDKHRKSCITNRAIADKTHKALKARVDRIPH